MNLLEFKEFLLLISQALMVLFFVIYFYQVVYCFIPFIKKTKIKAAAKKNNRYAFLIAGRNEENVIGQLIKSIKEQDYPQDNLEVFVVADNCTDDTAKGAREAGAVVFERFDNKKRGKSYAIEFLLEKIAAAYQQDYFDGYFVFDADNLLEKNYVSEMNKSFNQGYEVLTSYRNSKNYGSNWISAGYALWFLKDSKFMNEPRMLLNNSCIVTGTGFLFSRRILQQTNGWIFHMLTEDIEFSTYHILNGVNIGYCSKAVFYDEQPETFSQSWNQRLRWIKGYYQVFAKYKWTLIKQFFSTGNFTYYDLLMLFIPAFAITFVQILVNGLLLLLNIGDFDKFLSLNGYICQAVGVSYVALYLLGLLTTVSEWKNIYTSGFKKILYTFTFPLFVFTYFPIACAAIFAEAEWKPIIHRHHLNINDIYKVK